MDLNKYRVDDVKCKIVNKELYIDIFLKPKKLIDYINLYFKTTTYDKPDYIDKDCQGICLEKQPSTQDGCGDL
jgi:hypothetical protein